MDVPTLPFHAPAPSARLGHVGDAPGAVPRGGLPVGATLVPRVISAHDAPHAPRVARGAHSPHRRPNTYFGCRRAGGVAGTHEKIFFFRLDLVKIDHVGGHPPSVGCTTRWSPHGHHPYGPWGASMGGTWTRDAWASVGVRGAVGRTFLGRALLKMLRIAWRPAKLVGFSATLPPGGS